VARTNPITRSQEVFTSKIRTAVAVAVSGACLTAAAALPAASQAQYNNFGILNSAEGYKLKTNSNTGPGCQPLFPVGGSGVPTGPIPPSSKITSPTTAGAVTSAQQEVQTTVGPATGVQVCEAG
jgi:hypothetical protein